MNAFSDLKVENIFANINNVIVKEYKKDKHWKWRRKKELLITTNITRVNDNGRKEEKKTFYILWTLIYFILVFQSSL